MAPIEHPPPVSQGRDDSITACDALAGLRSMQRPSRHLRSGADRSRPGQEMSECGAGRGVGELLQERMHVHSVTPQSLSPRLEQGVCPADHWGHSVFIPSMWGSGQMCANLHTDTHMCALSPLHTLAHSHSKSGIIGMPGHRAPCDPAPQGMPLVLRVGPGAGWPALHGNPVATCL